MPDISLPPTPTALPVSAATAATSGANASEPAAGSEAPPFAALLMNQIAAGLKLKSSAAVLPVTASAIAGREMPDGEILSPELLALMDSAALAAAGAADDPGLAADPAAATLVATATPVAAPIAGNPLSAATLGGTELERDVTSDGQKRPAATAILAANAGPDGKKLATDAEVGRKFELAAASSATQDQPAAARGEAATTPAPIHNVATTRLEAPVGTRQWDGEVANKVTWMATRNEQRADLVLTPPSLGRIEVSVSVNGDHATAVFTSINPAVREALEGAMPRLREAMLEAGINLGQTQVGSESPQQSPDKDKSGDNSAIAAVGTSRDPAVAGLPLADRFNGARGLVDVFA